MGDSPTPVFPQVSEQGQVAKAPVIEAFRYCWRDMLRLMCMSLMAVIPVVTSVFGAVYAVQPAYGNNFSKSVYLWIPMLGNVAVVVVIPFIGRLSDRIGRRPPVIAGALASGLLSYSY